MSADPSGRRRGELSDRARVDRGEDLARESSFRRLCRRAWTGVLPPGRARFRARSRTRASLRVRLRSLERGNFASAPPNGEGRNARSRRSWGLTFNAARARARRKAKTICGRSTARGAICEAALFGVNPRASLVPARFGASPGAVSPFWRSSPLWPRRSRQPREQAGRSVQAARALVPASLMADAQAHPDQGLRRHRPGQPWDEERHGRRPGRQLREVEARQGEGPDEELHERERRLRRAHGRADRRPGQAAGDPRDHARLSHPPLRPVLKSTRRGSTSAGVADFFVGQHAGAAERAGDR